MPRPSIAKFTIRIEPELLAQIRRIAAEQSRSVNQQIHQMLREWLRQIPGR